MTSPPDGSKGSDGHKDDDSDSKATPGFADLMGDTKPIDRGPELVTPKPSIRRGPESIQTKTAKPAFRWLDPEDRHRAAAPGVSDAQVLALGRGDPEPEERIDLHGARKKNAAHVIRKRIADARARGLRCVIVIHGRGQNSVGGEAVLRDAVPDWLCKGANAEHVLAIAPAPDRLGGVGATLVLLRAHSQI